MQSTLTYFPAPDAKAVTITFDVDENKMLWTPREHAQVMAVVKKRCANYDRENHECLMMDGCGCALETSLHPCCNYFRDSVWGGDPSVPYEIVESAKKCARCGKAFMPTGNRAKYCAECAKQIDDEKHRARQRKYRLKK